MLSFSDIVGLCIALTIIGLWLSHLGIMLSVDLFNTPPLLLISAAAFQAFLNTGLFITAHDAIHGLVYPQNQNINTFLGTICATSYAFLSYEMLSKKHWLHHLYPGSEADPDFHKENASFPIWYFHFIRQYWGWKQFLQLASIIALLDFVFRFSPINLLLFWAFPLLLSSMQLFYFGTYRPHHHIGKDYDLTCCSESYTLPWLISFLACYHFGYHKEHHTHPNVPWWRLPAIHKTQQN
ncbi:fatty acid desaturase [Leptolyngbya sp. PCC 7375]|nr:fatty acid desaturase [Leptolyngbya sp. PCC 7375]